MVLRSSGPPHGEEQALAARHLACVGIDPAADLELEASYLLVDHREADLPKVKIRPGSFCLTEADRVERLGEQKAFAALETEAAVHPQLMGITAKAEAPARVGDGEERLRSVACEA